ncbi:hypothetical protein BRARA_B01650 [Brassica rapa]|uniref:F-box domain-containing protein n=1 Tax=Brassica campestris TaxID=3711 RepID=A0A398A9Q0_BRACM|nr:hypothetical protein BRARA_B01650 [Brassica rapa]
MDSSDQADRISNLPDVLLVLIVSCLSFKECVQTCALSKRIHEQTFEISISYPKTYLDVIESLIAFAVHKRVKNLVHDFSNPAWRTFHDVNLDELVVEIPQSVYDLATLESLKVGACKKFDPAKLSNLGKLKTVSFGWMELKNPELFLKTSRVEKYERIINCVFLLNCIFNLPRVDILKYSGDLFRFEFDNMNIIISEVEFDFRVLDNNNDESKDSNTAEGGMLCHLLNNLLDDGGRSATTLTVCPFLLKMIPKSEHPHFLGSMETKHLVLKTELHPR